MADGTSFGFSHSRILLCDAAGVVVFQPRSLRPTFCSLKKIVMTQSIAHVVQAIEKRHEIAHPLAGKSSKEMRLPTPASFGCGTAAR
jgi:hypothetical protein